MVDYTANISDSCHGSDGVFVENSILVQETKGNLLSPYIATGTDVEGNSQELGSVKGQGTDHSSSSTEQAYFGSKSIKVLCEGVYAGEGFFSNNTFGMGFHVGCNPNQKYTFSTYIYGTVGTTLKLRIYARTSGVYTSDPITLVDGWQRVSFTATTPNNVSYLEVAVVTDSIQTTTFYLDGLQLEEGNTATEWKYPSMRQPYDPLSIKNTVSVSEGFTPRNLLPADVASCTDISGGVGAFGRNAGTETITSDITQYKQGSRCLKCVTPGSGLYEGITLHEVRGLIVGQRYTGQGWIKTSVGTNLFYGINGVGTTILTGTGDWQFITYSFVATQTVHIPILVTRETAQAITFYVDCLQLELGNVATPWMGGNLLSYNQQTVETDLSGLAPGNCSMVRDTTICYKGSASLKGTRSGSPVNCTIGTPYNSPIPVKPSTTYLVKITGKRETPNQLQLNTIFYDKDGILCGVGTFYKTFISNNDWKEIIYVGVSPSNAASCYVSLKAISLNDGESFWWDEAWLVEYPIDDIQIQNQLQITEEQGNILLPNQAYPCMLGTVYGFNCLKGGETRGVITSDYYIGDSCLKVTTPGLVNIEGIWLWDPINSRYNIVPGATYTFTVILKGSGTVYFRIEQYNDQANIGYGASRSSGIILTDTWTVHSFTVTLDSRTKRITPLITTEGTNIVTFYVGGCQLEKGSTFTNLKYPSIGPVNDKPSIKATVPVAEHIGNYYPENTRTTEYLHSIDTNPSIGTPPTITQTDEVVYPGFKHSMKVQWNHIGGDYWKGECQAPSINIPKGSQVTFKIKTYAPVPFSVYIYTSGSCAGGNVTKINIGPQWDTWELSYKNTCPYGNNFNIYFYGPSAQNVMYVTGIECYDYDYENSGAVDLVSEKVQLNIPDSDVQVVEEISETVLVSSNENVEEAEYTKVISNVNYNESIHSTESIGIVNYLRQTDIGQSIEKVILDVIRRIKKSGIIGRNKYYTGIVNSDKKETVKVNSNKGYTGKIRGK